MIQSLFYTVLGLLVLLCLLIAMGNMIYVPVAAIFSLPMYKGAILVSAITWTWVTGLGVALLWNTHGYRIKRLLGAREAQKLTLLEQRIKDGKEGICTIVEVV